MQRLTILLITLSTFLGCQTNTPPPSRPDSLLCVNNVPGLHKKCYNLLKDYDDNGALLPGAIPTVIQYKTPEEMLEGVNKDVNTPPDGWANIKAYIRALRDAWPK